MINGPIKPWVRGWTWRYTSVIAGTWKSEMEDCRVSRQPGEHNQMPSQNKNRELRAYYSKSLG